MEPKPMFEEFLAQVQAMHDRKGQHYDPIAGPRYQNYRDAVGCEPWVACWNRIREKVARVNRAIQEQEHLEVASNRASEEILDIAVLGGIMWILLHEAPEG